MFSGGTLCAEAQSIFLAAELPVLSNAPIPGVSSMNAAAPVMPGHRLLDLGDDDHTRGRPHPMIDPMVRDDAITAALNDAAVAVILVDVVIGLGAHPDPAGYLAALLTANQRSKGPAVIASVTGTEADPQVRSLQVATLEAAGVHVAPTNADAAAWSLSALRSTVAM